MLHARIACDPAVEIVERIERDGYAVIRNVIDPDMVERLNREMDAVIARARFSRGEFYGPHTKRAMGLLNHSRAMQDLVRHPLILPVADGVLSECDTIQLNGTQLIDVHPGAPQQVPHRDHAMWHKGPRTLQFMLNVMWPLSTFTRRTGATKIWPGSHRIEEGVMLDLDDAIDIEAEPGDVLLFTGLTLHGQGENSSDAIRRGLIVSYSLGWLKQFENMFLTYPPEVARSFPPDLAALLGYRMQRPNLGSFGGECPSLLLGDRMPDGFGASDYFRQEQTQETLDFHALLGVGRTAAA